jgi:hypothetical protein
MESNLNFFEEEFARVGNENNYMILSEVLKINSMDENNQFKINLAHIRKNKLYLIFCHIKLLYFSSMTTKMENSLYIILTPFHKFILKRKKFIKNTSSDQGFKHILPF